MSLRRVHILIIILAALIAGSGWSWHHEVQQFTNTAGWNALIASIILSIVGVLAAYVFLLLLHRRAGLASWAKDLPDILTALVAWGYSAGFALLLPSDIWRAGFFIFWCFFGMMYFRRIGQRHMAWMSVSHAVSAWGTLSLYIFVIMYGIQYADHKYSILDPHNLAAIHIVLYRTFTITLIWLALLALLLFVCWPLGKKMRAFAVIVWSLLWTLLLLVELINLGLLYFSGLELSPVALDHAEGSNGILLNPVSMVLIGILLGSVIILVFLARYFIRKKHASTPHPWWLMGAIIIFLTILGTWQLDVIWRTPEYTVIKSFYDRYIAKIPPPNLPPELQAKLVRFGLKYNLDNFNVAEKDVVFEKNINALPERLQAQKPNVLVIFWESLSSRLTGIYNEKYIDVTPGLMAFGQDPHVTMFHHYYNSSTPTITGTLSQLCSFLPPTGHSEIEKQKKVQSLDLTCLPQVLRENGWQHAEYVTAVSKDFANKDKLLKSIGVDSMYGIDELREALKTEPLSWGYSDHQMFPFIQAQMEKLPQPFFEMLATVDTHPPFTTAQDMVYYGNGQNTVLNSFHTTDDAFLKFWQWFMQSPLAQNTIVLIVGDHSAFPSWPIQQTIVGNGTEKLTFYDENYFGIYIPENTLPRKVDMYSSGIDFAPTLLQILNININNAFEGHSIFDDRDKYKNILGMHELGLYINQEDAKGKRKIDYNIPSVLKCPKNEKIDVNAPLTLCEYKNFYEWKRAMFEQGRLWKK